MDAGHEELLPGSHTCVGCGGLTFRRREDHLCPRCAFEAEQLIERIELDGLDRDLELMARFDAYYQRRAAHQASAHVLPFPLFGETAVRDSLVRPAAEFMPDPFWQELREAS